MRSLLIAGGAGFVGSAICRAFSAQGWVVHVIDGIMPRTSGRADNVTQIPNVTLDERPIEAISDLKERVGDVDLVIDAMGWTRHLEATLNPEHDLKLNVASHLPLVSACAAVKPPLVIFFGSRHQYGRPDVPLISEATPLAPIDVQGIHKTAAESHWRRAAAQGASVVSLRFGNTFGPGQPTGKGDIGLIGGFMRDALEHREIVIYGGGRRRNVLFAPDFAEAVERFAGRRFAGFRALNVAGRDVLIGDLAKMISASIGARTTIAPLPDHLTTMEVGEAEFDGSEFESIAGPVVVTPFSEALQRTMEYVRGQTYNANA